MSSSENSVIRSRASEPTGNTKARRFQLTLNQVSRWEELKSYLMSYKSFRYIVASHEIAPETGHEHIHVYVCYDNTLKMNLKKTCGAHIEVCRGNHQQNVDYIKKDGDVILEEGDPPHQGKKLTASDLRNMSVNEVVENDPRCHRAYLNARDILLNGGYHSRILRIERTWKCIIYTDQVESVSRILHVSYYKNI